MKINGKSIALSVGLCVVLLIVLLAEFSIFSSGPSRKYEEEVRNQMTAIQETYREIENLHRDAFYYITYIGEDSENYVWFNEKGQAIISKEKSSLQMNQVKDIAAQDYNMEDAEITLGYGYDNPVYVITDGVTEIRLDYDDLHEVYYLLEGEA
ncbi:hypothetical protein WKT02_00340 [Erysipelotrichaceae bacterium HCN-30851]